MCSRRAGRSRLAVSEIVEEVESFEPGLDARVQRSRQLTLELLQGTPAPFDRNQFEPGHLTASAIVFSPDRARVLLVRHRRLQRWLQPGGHVEESDAGILASAERELAEETEVRLDPNVEAVLVGIDVHEIPASGCEPTHLHHDLIFRFAARSEECHSSPESEGLVWAKLDELARFDLDDALLRNIERAQSW